MNNNNIDNLIKNISQHGKVYFYGSTAVFNYFNKTIKVYRILTDVNIAKIAQFLKNPIFTNKLYFSCYSWLDEETIVTFFIDEEYEKDDYKYIKNVNLKHNEKYFISFCYSPVKRKYFTLLEKSLNDLKKNIINIKDLKKICLEDLLDIALITGMSKLQIKENNKQAYRYNIKNFIWYSEFDLKTFLPFIELVLTCKYPYQALIFLDKIGLLRFIFPFLNDLVGIEQDRIFHPEGDVFNHTIHCFQFIKNPTLRLSIGLLLHDYGKFLSKNSKNFREHSTLGVKKVRELLMPYGYSDSFIKDIEFLVEYHMVNSYFFRISNNERIRFFNNELGIDLLKLFRADTLGSIGKLDKYHEIIAMLNKKIKSKLY